MLSFILRARRALGAAALILFVMPLAGCWGGGDSSPAPAATGSVGGRVTASDTGLGIAGVTASVAGLSATSGADGSYTIAQVPAGTRKVIAFSISGYVASQAVADVNANASSAADARLTPIAATRTFDAAAGATVVVSGSPAQVTLPANGLVVNGTSTAATGTVTAEVTPIDPARDPANMPGDYRTAAASGGGTAPIESFGALNVTLRDAAGNTLNLASGQTATIRIPVASRSASLPATIPLFYFDTSTGLWVQEGTATLRGSAPQQYYEGTVSHFTTWNCDRVYETIQLHACIQDAGGARVANVLVESLGLDYSGTGSAFSDANGQFSLPMRLNGQANIIAMLNDRASNVIQAGPSGQDITLSNCLVFGASGSPPVLALSPASQTVDPGAFVVFRAYAVGAGPIRYQWQRDGVDIPGATTAWLVLGPVTNADNGAHLRVIASNPFGSVTSADAVLTVNAVASPPTITSQPQNAAVAVGATADFSVAADGAGRPLTYQWQRNGTSIAGATQASYTTPATTSADNGAVFTVVVSATGTSVTSNPAVLTVQVPTAPTITAQPAAAAVTVGQSALFAVTASGTGPLAYQWRRNGNNIAGATARTYTTPATVLADNGAQFSVVVSNSAGSATSNNAALSVTQASGGAGLYLLGVAGPSVAGSITFANGPQSFNSQALVVVPPLGASNAATLEPAGTVSFFFTGAFEGTVASTQLSNLHQRFATYFKGTQLYTTDLQVASGLPTPRVVSTLAPSMVCGSFGAANSSLNADGNDFADASRSWQFFQAPGADNQCGTSDDTYKAVRLTMAAGDAPLTIGEPLVDVVGSNGALNGVIVRNGTNVQQLNADLGGAATLFAVPGATLTSFGLGFGSAAPGVWIFLSGNTIYGYKIGSGAAAPTALTTLASGETYTGIGASDGANGYLAIGGTTGTRVIAVNETALAVTPVATLAGVSAVSLQVTPSRVVLETNSGSTFGVVSVPKGGGVSASLVPSEAGWLLSTVLAVGENVYYEQTAAGATAGSVHLRTGVVGADATNRTVLDNTGIVGSTAAATDLLTNGLLNRYAVFLATGTSDAGYFAGSTVKAVNGATRADLVTYGTLPATPRAFAFNLGLSPAQYGLPGLISFTPLDTSGAGATDLFWFDSDTAGLVKVTSFNSAGGGSSPLAARGGAPQRRFGLSAFGRAQR